MLAGGVEFQLGAQHPELVRRHRLTHNVARHAMMPPVVTAERKPWTAAEAVTFLHYVHRADDRLANLFEVIIGTGLRCGEALALRWTDLDLTPRALVIHPIRGTVRAGSGRTPATGRAPSC